jgi:hypothetical protein
MKKLRGLLVILVALGLVFGLTGCEELDGDDATPVSFQSFSPRSITVDNMTRQRLVAFKGSLHRDFLIGGIPADSRNHGLERKISLFSQTGDFALVLITEADYEKNRNSLQSAPIFAEVYAFYNHTGDNLNSFQISSRVGGAGRITLNNPTEWNIEIRRNSPTGEILGYVAANTVNTALRLEIPDDYDLFPVFKRYHATDREIYTVVPKFLTGAATLIGRPFMQPFTLINDTPQTWNFAQLASNLNFSISSGGIYIRVFNDSNIAIRFARGNEELETSLGVRGIRPNYDQLYNIPVTRNPDGTFPESQIIGGYSIGTTLDMLPLTERVYKTDYIYTVRITGTDAANLNIGEIIESAAPMDLEAKFRGF